MNKRLTVVAAALIAASTSGYAQSVSAATNVSVSGLLTVGLKNSEISQGKAPTARAGLKSETRLDDNTSRVIISANHKIADGWLVIATVESRFTADVRPATPLAPTSPTGQDTGSVTGWADGDSFGGIVSPYGTLTFGKRTLYYFDTGDLRYLAPSLEGAGEGQRIWDANSFPTFNLLSQVPLVQSLGVIWQQGTNGLTRSANVIRYDSKTIKGFDVALAWSKYVGGDEVKYPGINTPNGTTYQRSYDAGGTAYARVRYNGNGISASASYLLQRVQGGIQTAPAALGTTAGPLDTDAFRLGVSYRLPMVPGLKVGVVYDNTSVKNAISAAAVAYGATPGKSERSAYSVPVSYSFGQHAVYATYTKADSAKGWKNSGATQLNLGYDYALTKRAFIGVIYAQIDNDRYGKYGPFLAGTSLGPSANTVGESWRQVGINFNYWF